MARNTYLKMLSPNKAKEIWFARIGEVCASPGEEVIALDQALDRVVSQPVSAKRSSPAFHGAAMDGIAIKAEKTFWASSKNPIRLEINKDAFWINTGKPLPPNTNAVIMVEDVNTEEDGRFAVVEKAAFPWQHVRKTGEDMVATEIILAPGTLIGPYEIGALAAAGVMNIPVYKQPKVAIIPSGSEITPLEDVDDQELNSGQFLPEFNSLVFSAMLKRWGAKPIVMPVVPDDLNAIIQAILAAIQIGADLILINAGASAGSHDFTSEAVNSCGEVLVHGVTMMPGKPTILGIAENGQSRIPLIGAPGYPISGIMALEEFVLPLLSKWQHRAAPPKEMVEVFACNPLPSKPGMEERIRVKLGMVNGKYYAIPLPRGAGTVSSLSRADGIVSIPANSEGINTGEGIQARLLRPKSQIEKGLLAVGSHDNTLELIDSLIRKKYPSFRLSSAHVGSLGGLVALAKGQSHLAGSHLLDTQTGEYNKSSIKQQLNGTPVSLVRLVEREQGLMVKPGNPLNIKGFNDLTRKDVHFINRQRGSGTRVLLDYELEKAGIKGWDIQGYGDEEYTHMNIASAVLSGRADTGLGARSAANALGLDFIPVGLENYDVVIPKSYMNDARILALLEVIRSNEFKEAVLAMGGYGLDKSGEIIWEYDGK